MCPSAHGRQTSYYRDSCTSAFTATPITVVKLQKHHRHPTAGTWIKKMWNISTLEFFSPVKRNNDILYTGE